MFTSLYDAVTSSAHQFAPAWLITEQMIDEAVTEAGKLAHFEPIEASSSAPSPRPKVLLIHGSDDSKLPSSFSQRLHAVAPERSELIVVEGAGHDSMMSDTVGVLKERILAWLAKELI